MPTRIVPAWPGSRCSAAVLGLLTELAAAAPVLLVLEDLHWADASTRDLVTFLSRMLHRERVALIGTYRTDDLHRRHPLRPVVAELLRLPSVIAVDLAPLDPSALAEHLTAALAEHLMAAAPGRIDAIELNDIVARAEGNAYYAEELLAAFVSGDPAERRALPAGLAALAAQPGGAAVRHRAAGAPRGGGGRAPGRRRAGPRRVRPGGRRIRGRGPGGGHAPVARDRRHRRLRLPARPAARGRLRGPAARRADQAARHDEFAALRGAAARGAGNGRRTRPALPGQPRHSRRVRRLGPSRGGGRAAGRASRGAPALRPGARPVGACRRAGEDGRPGPRQAGPAVRDQRGRQRRLRARRPPAPHGCGRRSPPRPTAATAPKTSSWPAGSASASPPT